MSVILWVLFTWIFQNEFLEPLVNKLCYLPSQLLVGYAFLYWLLPYLFQGRYLRFFILILPLSYMATVLARFLKIYVYETILSVDADKESLIQILTETPHLMVQYMIWVFLFPIISLTIVLIIYHFKEKSKLEHLKQEKQLAELSFLKAQVHPHFLFNTLNNLYTLALQKSPKTAEITRKLRDILVYMFHKCNEPRVRIVEEINLIQNYIDLESIRYGKRLKVIFDHEIENKDFQIAPLMLLSLVENAFKHGASGDLGVPEIIIKLYQKKDSISFEIFNTKPKKLSKDKQEYRKGIGLKNVKRQLALVYENQFDIQIYDREKSFEVKIKVSEKESNVE